MGHKFKKISRALLYASLAVYPALVFYFLVIRKTQVRVLSLFVFAFALLAFIAGTSSERSKRKPSSLFWTSFPLLGVGALCLLTNSGVILKFYPLLMNLIFFAAFGITLFKPPSMIYRFAVLIDKSIPNSLGEKKIAAYCRKVTVVWLGYFVVNGSVAAWTIFSGSDFFWAVYNSGISYILMGSIFAVEIIVRKRVKKAMPKAVPLSMFKKNSRDPSMVMCYEGAFSDACYRTWQDFLDGTAALRRQIEAVDSEKWLLYCEDCWDFLLAFTALLQCKKEI
ncbi:MAG: acyl-CoA synthetase, partial [Treponema sp.]|nr:acyl-CoA synthetase [Treponema sp.]